MCSVLFYIGPLISLQSVWCLRCDELNNFTVDITMVNKIVLISRQVAGSYIGLERILVNGCKIVTGLNRIDLRFP